MEIFIAEQCKTLAESCIMGLIFGAGYDIIRILHVLCGTMSICPEEKRKLQMHGGRTAFLLFLAGDLFYMLLVTVSASVFLYHANYGQFRLYLAAACIAGFCLYRYTAGRLMMGVAGALVGLIRRILYHTLIRPIRWFLQHTGRLAQKTGRMLAAVTVGWIRKQLLRRRMRRYVRQFPVFVRL